MRAFPIVLLVLLPMAGGALWLRIAEHGLTPLRVVRAYGVICLAVLSVAGAWRCVRGRGALTWQVPAVLLVGALVAAVGPLSAVQLSVRSQAAELARQLDALGVGRVVAREAPPTKISLDRDQLDPLASRFDLLIALDGEAGLRRVLTGDLTVCRSAWSGQTCLAHLGVRDIDVAAAIAASAQVVRHEVTDLTVPTSTGALIFVDALRNEGAPAPDAEAIARSEAGAGGVVLTADEVVVYRHGAWFGSASLAAFLAAPGFAMPVRAVPVIGGDGAVIGELAIRRLGVRHTGAQNEVIELFGALLLN
jgi:hypothetical protein